MSDAPDSKSEPMPDLDDLLQCPVCYEVPTGQIFQCNEGHHVCGRCKSRLKDCPVCRSMFFGTRNYVMEELITKIKNLQAFKLAGKMTVASSECTTSADTSIAVNETNQRDASESDDTRASTSNGPPAACKGLFRCLCCKPGKTERLPAARLLNHLRYFHANDLLEGKSEEGEYVQAWQLSPVLGRQAVAVRVADMGIFFLVIEISEATLYSWLAMAATALVSHDFCYVVTITGGDREIVFSDSVSSVRSCEGTLKKRSRCLEASGGDAAAVRATATMTAKLTLRRTSGEQITIQNQARTVVRVASRPAPVGVAPTGEQQPPRSRNARRRQRLREAAAAQQEPPVFFVGGFRVEEAPAPVVAPPVVAPAAQVAAPARPRRRRR